MEVAALWRDFGVLSTKKDFFKKGLAYPFASETGGDGDTKRHRDLERVYMHREMLSRY